MKYEDAYIGQRVVWLGEQAGGCWPLGIRENATGTVAEILPDDDGYCIGVKWDEYVSGHSINGHAQSGYGYYMFPKSIDPIDELKEEIKIAFDDLFERSK